MTKTTSESAPTPVMLDSQFFMQVLDGLDHSFLVLDAETHKICYANAASGGASAVGQTCHSYIHGSPRPCAGSDHRCPLQLMKRTLKPVTVEHHHGTRGQACDVEVHAHPIFDAEGRLSQMIEYSLDITKRKALQAQLIHSDRLATIGTLAAGIAHELRTPLSYVSANTELSEDLVGELREKLVKGSQASEMESLQAGLQELAEMLQDNAVGVKRMQELVSSVRGFSSGASNKADDGSAQQPEIELSSVVETARKLAFNELKYRAQVEVDLEEGLPKIRGHEGHLSQVVLNLLINAAHAIEPGHQDQNTVRIEGHLKGGAVYLALSDTGSGIPAENLERIFDPFFTTKSASQGTGLGLYLCKQFVAEQGGDLSVSSELGVGTTFVIRLPLRTEDEMEEQLPKATAPAADLPSHGLAEPQCGEDAALLLLRPAGYAVPAVEDLLRQGPVVELQTVAATLRWLRTKPSPSHIVVDLPAPERGALVVVGWIARNRPALAARLLVLAPPESLQQLRSLPELQLFARSDRAGLAALLGEPRLCEG